MSREVNWDRLVGELLHPTQATILAAMELTGEALSPSLLEKVLDEAISLGSLDYHFKRLADLGAVEVVRERQVRGAIEKFWRPAP
jgi:DNA-binding transcriptional ArsR family regulator